MNDTPRCVDPEVTRIKFEREVLRVRALEDYLWQRGCWIRTAVFPVIQSVFVAAKISPPVVLFGASIDFTNYDLWPPSVTVVDALSWEPYRFKTLPAQLLRKVPGTLPAQMSFQFLLQAHDPEHVPFLCLPGVREYHAHPAHSGDSWMLHRGRGEGTLYFILDQMCRYGPEAAKGLKVDVSMQAKVNGVTLEPQP